MGETRVRERAYAPADGSLHLGTKYKKFLGTMYNQGEIYAPFTETDHRGYRNVCYDRTNPGPPYLTGGGVIIDAYDDRTALTQNVGVHVGNSGYEYHGGFICTNPLRSLAVSAGLPTISGGVMPESLYSSYTSGATAWNRFAPGKTFLDGGVALAELKDFPRMIKDLESKARGFYDIYKKRGGWRNTLGPKALANDFLGTTFGWLPFVSDIHRAYKGFRKLDATITNIKKHNGKWLKRRGTIQDEKGEATVVSASSTSTMHWPLLTSYFYPDPQRPGSYEITLQETHEEWFEGKFRYYIPDIATPEWERRVVRQLFGLSITPSLLWELIPWSWMIDWASNFGDVFANMDDAWAENLTAAYAYIMGTRSWTWNVHSTHDLVGGAQTASWTGRISRKDRHVASPFGFGLSGPDFSPRQLSILTALGISRLAHFR